MHAGLLTLVCLAGALATGSPARAETFVGSVATPGCESALTWRIGVRIYEIDRDAKAQRTLENLGEYAANVGAYSECAVRVHADVFYMDGQPWPGNYPRDAAEFRKRYDSGFYVYLTRGETWVGATNLSDAEFPAVADLNGHPNWVVFMHEWLHIVAGFYKQANWPPNTDKGDIVHQQQAHGYALDYEATQTYFADILTGRVGPNGYGMRREQWTFWGTPLAPLNQPPTSRETTGRRTDARNLVGAEKISRRRLQIKASPTARGQIATIRYYRRGGRPTGKLVRVKLRASLTLTIPTRAVRAQVSVPDFVVNGVLWRGTTLKVRVR